jgi:hypothetical protein
MTRAATTSSSHVHGVGHVAASCQWSRRGAVKKWTKWQVVVGQVSCGGGPVATTGIMIRVQPEAQDTVTRKGSWGLACSGSRLQQT